MKIQQKEEEQSIANKNDRWSIDDQDVREARCMQIRLHGFPGASMRLQLHNLKANPNHWHTCRQISYSPWCHTTAWHFQDTRTSFSKHGLRCRCLIISNSVFSSRQAAYLYHSTSSRIVTLWLRLSVSLLLLTEVLRIYIAHCHSFWEWLTWLRGRSYWVKDDVLDADPS